MLNREELGRRIRALRVERGYSTRTFALMVGMSRTHLLSLEATEASPTFDMLERICAGLDVEPRHMVDFRWEGPLSKD